MRVRLLTSLITVAAVAATAHSVAPNLTAQTSAPARRPPDLQGVWRAWNLAKYDLEDHGAKPGVPAGRGFVVDPSDGRIPYKPEALAKREKNYVGTKDPDPWNRKSTRLNSSHLGISYA